MNRMTKERKAELDAAFSIASVGRLGAIYRELSAEVDACWSERDAILAALQVPRQSSGDAMLTIGRDEVKP